MTSRHLSPVRTPVPLWIYITAGIAVAAAIFVMQVLSSPSKTKDSAPVWVAATSSSETKKPVTAKKTSVPKLPTINGYTYPDPQCVNDWPKTDEWVGVGRTNDGRLKTVTPEQMEAWANGTFPDSEMPDVDIYCPPYVTVE